jgi:nitroreductase
MEQQYDIGQFNSIVQNRRSFYPNQFEKGKIIPEEIIWQILENANRAPTHKLTQPWRFIVYSGKGREAFADIQTEVYRKYAGEKFNEKKLKNLQEYPLSSSHVIVVYMKRSDPPAIPEIEEIISVGAAIENIYLSLTAYGLGGYLSTGGITYIEEAKAYLDLDAGDKIIGTFFLGYPVIDMYPLTKRTPVSKKVKWVKRIW